MTFVAIGALRVKLQLGPSQGTDLYFKFYVRIFVLLWILKRIRIFAIVLI